MANPTTVPIAHEKEWLTLVGHNPELRRLDDGRLVFPDGARWLVIDEARPPATDAERRSVTYRVIGHMAPPSSADPASSDALVLAEASEWVQSLAARGGVALDVSWSSAPPWSTTLAAREWGIGMSRTFSSDQVANRHHLNGLLAVAWDDILKVRIDRIRSDACPKIGVHPCG